MNTLVQKVRYTLTPRQRQVLAMLLEGLPSRQIATSLHISLHTLRDHTRQIYAKLGARSRAELMARFAVEFVREHRLFDPPERWNESA